MSKEKKKTSQVTRREFIKVAAVGTAGMAAAGSLAGCSVPEAGVSAVQPMTWDEEADVVIVGTGAAGLSAAVEAADNGASVLVLEKLPSIGGCSRASGGNYGSAGDDLQLQMAEEADNPEYFLDDSAELYYQEKLKLGGYINDPEVVRVWADEARDGYEWFRNLGMIHTTVRMYSSLGPVRQPDNPKAMYFFNVWNTPFEDGEWIGAFTKGRHHRGGTYEEFSSGEAGVMCLADAAEERGAEIRTEMQVTEIIRENGLSGDVLGVKVRDLANDADLMIRAKKGVVLAAGGFAANAEMCKKYDPRLTTDRVNSGSAAPGALTDGGRPGREATDSPGRGTTGEVLVAAIDIGADVHNLSHTQLRMARSTAAYTGPKAGVPVDEGGEYIDVDGEGNRFWMEGGELATDRYARLTHLHEKGIRTRMGNHTWWGICDSQVMSDDPEEVQTYLDNEQAFVADTLEELAGIMEVPAENLVATVERYNELVDMGADEDFGRLSEDLTHKIEQPPFYAMPKCYYRHHSMGGVRINPNAEVVDRRGQVIPRLYAAGEQAGSTQGKERNGGCGWTDCIVFGRIAGRNAAGLESSA